MTVHNHGPEDGPGLACPESRVDGQLRGACLGPHGVTQTILHGDPERPGNCLAAAVATFTGRPLTEVPHFVEWDDKGLNWWALLIGYMAGSGYWPEALDSVDDAEPGEIVFVAGPSPRGVTHQVLYRDGALFHDPHPSRAGITSVTEVTAWRRVVHDHTPTEAGR